MASERIYEAALQNAGDKRIRRNEASCKLSTGLQETLGQTGLPRTLANFLPCRRNRPRNVVVAHLPTIITRRGAPVHQGAQEIDYGIIVHAARDEFAGEIAQ